MRCRFCDSSLYGIPGMCLDHLEDAATDMQRALEAVLRWMGTLPDGLQAGAVLEQVSAALEKTRRGHD